MIARTVATAGLATLGIFQAGLAAGRPWGAASYGGAHPGVLPRNLRITSAVAAPVYLVAATSVGAGVRTGLGPVALVMAVATVPNALSPSRAEKLWSPVCAAVAWAAWSMLRRS
ncbi:hypothetical protein [Corynebacterium sp.]|uniref:hypothetical protein n=1 Tax=Corynebacterium sp. TaxID=1720 RepID=UPI0026E0B6EC|nr:hypothetical protein [Corynebacterium sp.]MDO5511823.1 hypothetical protein [Corynebacterium sp.]